MCMIPIIYNNNFAFDKEAKLGPGVLSYAYPKDYEN